MPDLISQINSLVVPRDTLALWALGQSGFVLKGDNTIAYIDPYLSNYVDEAGYAPPGSFPRQFPPPILPEEVTNAQIVFCSHEDADHTDPKTIEPINHASPRAIFIGPTNSADIFRKVGIGDERIIVPQADAPRSIGELTFTAIPSSHYRLDYDAARGYRFFGYVIELNGVTLYHAGDTILYEGLVEQLKQKKIDLACLPVNGRDWWREQRGMVGNIDMREAAELAVTIGADVLIPMHNDMFSENHANPALLADYLDHHFPRQKYHWLQPGELYFYLKG